MDNFSQLAIMIKLDAIQTNIENKLATSDKNQLILNPDEPFTFKREVITTEDGSSTIFLPELNENYHSIHGAIQESMHVFIDAGLKQINADKIKIFEVGFGTGLNCWLTYKNAVWRNILYHAIERFPIGVDLVQKLNYSQVPESDDGSFFGQVHELPWEMESKVRQGFTLHKFKGDLISFQPKHTYNLIYFDAFAPEVQPELWIAEIFQKMFDMLDPGGILVTYCAKGEVRRTMQACGFVTERLPGPPGKREMLRAIKN
jgi:tRNA U34 5-methylaminomethyl-2-thiouridine-forming methyltransferase MnmC